MNGVIYARARCFNDCQQEDIIIERQIRECTGYANRNDIIIVDTYVDKGCSTNADRPEFHRMLLESRKGTFEHVLVSTMDRFSRNRYDSAYYKTILRENGVKVAFCEENISEGPESIILESMFKEIAEYYAAELSARIRRGQRNNIYAGRSNGAPSPFGLKIGVDKIIEVDPMTASIVLEIFKRYASGETKNSIIASLNERGILTKKLKPFVSSSFNVLLTNRKYIGEYKYKDEVIRNAIPAIVPQDLFDHVQELLKKNK